SPVAVTFNLPPEYPMKIPQISISSPHMKREETQIIVSQLSDVSQNLIGENMMMDLIMWIQEKFSDFVMKNRCDPVSTQLCDKQDSATVLLHLDHMRSRGKYQKFISKWTAELCICGCLLFLQRFIFIILQGCPKNIKEFIHRQRTVSVDVDSRGKSCKERMLAIIAEIDSPKER
ncbi:hypothetical protein CAPTEDRAFT_147020, partial [Capitella teleta]